MTDPTKVLREELAHILRQTSSSGINLVLAGGFGVLLRIDQARRSAKETLAPLPVARSTRDLDVVLPADVIVDPRATGALRRVLDDAGYEPFPGAEYYQFRKEKKVDGVEVLIKVDLFAQEPPEDAPVKRDARRIRPRHFTGLHAHRATEAIAITESPVLVPLSAGVSAATPNSFSYWILKLFALRDRIVSDEVELARQHAYDLYTLWASTDKGAWEAAQRISAGHSEHLCVLEARRFINSLFGTMPSIGTIRLREALRREGNEPDPDLIGDFCSDLLELLPPIDG